MRLPQVSYARTRTGSLAWQAWGEGDLVLLDCGVGTMFSLDDIPDEPRWLRLMTRLSAFARVLVFDYPGTGLSDGDAALYEDLSALPRTALDVLDAAGVEHAAVMASGAHCWTALLLAAQTPARVDQLVLLDPWASLVQRPGYPHGLPPAQVAALLAAADPYADHEQTADERDDLQILAPTLAADPDFRSWWTRAARRGASPQVAAAANRLIFTGDVRHVLPQVRCRTTILQPAADTGMSDYVAEHLADSRRVRLSTPDAVPFGADGAAVAEHVREALTGDADGGPVEREFAVVLFTDVVASTALAAEIGDRRWRELQQAHLDVVARELKRHRGRLAQDLGDGTLCLFSSPGRAVECALALVEAVRPLGLEIRAGVHAGEVELRDAGVAGINVHVGARVASLAGPGEVLVSSTVVDLVAGSGYRFVDRGTHELKGVSGARQVWAVVP